MNFESTTAKYTCRIPENQMSTSQPENTLVEFKTRKHHGRVGSGRTAGRRGGAGQDGTPTEQFAQETSVPRTPHGIEDTSFERLSTCRVQNPDIPQAGRSGSGRGGAWPGRKRRRRFGSPRRHLSLVHTRVPKTTVLNDSSEARTVKFVLKTDGRTKPAVDNRFIRG